MPAQGRLCLGCSCCNRYPLADDARCRLCGGQLGGDYAEHVRYRNWVHFWRWFSMQLIRESRTA